MKKNSLKRIICICLVFIMVFVESSFASVNDVRSDLDDVNKQIEKIQKELEKNKKSMTSLTKEIAELDIKILSTQADIVVLTDEINGVKDLINAKLELLNDKESEVGKQNDDLNARLRTMYKNGNGGILSVLLHSTSIVNLLTNIEMAKRIYAADNNVLMKLHSEYDEIYQAKLDLTNLKDELCTKQDELESKKANMAADQRKAAAKRAAVKADSEELEAQEDLLQKEADALIAEIRKLQSGGEYIGGDMCWPSRASKRITSKFGMRTNPVTGQYKLHTGIDIGAAGGTDILAAASGTVIAAGYKPSSYGNYIMIDHGGKIVTLYGHASKLLVKTGDVVKRGQVIALVGSTGMSTGNHLHFEIRVNGSYQDPLDKTARYYVEPGVFIY